MKEIQNELNIEPNDLELIDNDSSPKSTERPQPQGGGPDDGDMLG
jgi:hypothetical protein